MTRIGYKIKERLAELGMAQRELADKAGLTEVSVCRYISEDRTPKATVLKKIADVLDVTMDYLLDAEEDDNNDVDCFYCTDANCKKYVEFKMDGGIFGEYEIAIGVIQADSGHTDFWKIPRLYVGFRESKKEESFYDYIPIKFCPFCGRDLQIATEEDEQ